MEVESSGGLRRRLNEVEELGFSLEKKERGGGGGKGGRERKARGIFTACSRVRERERGRRKGFSCCSSRKKG